MKLNKDDFELSIKLIGFIKNRRGIDMYAYKFHKSNRRIQLIPNTRANTMDITIYENNYPYQLIRESLNDYPRILSRITKILGEHESESISDNT